MTTFPRSLERCCLDSLFELSPPMSGGEARASTHHPLRPYRADLRGIANEWVNFDTGKLGRSATVIALTGASTA